MRIHDHRSSAGQFTAWQRAHQLLIEPFEQYRGQQDQAVFVSAAEPLRRPGGQPAMQHTRQTHIPLQLRPEPDKADSDRRDRETTDPGPLAQRELPSEQPENENQCKQVQRRVAGAQVHQVSRQQAPYFTRQNRFTVVLKQLSRRIADRQEKLAKTGYQDRRCRNRLSGDISQFDHEISRALLSCRRLG